LLCPKIIDLKILIERKKLLEFNASLKVFDLFGGEMPWIPQVFVSVGITILLL
jgi:hypothetical protein